MEYSSSESGGQGNIGTVKLNGISYSLPMTNPPKFDFGSSVTIEASSTSHTSLNIKYNFSEWIDGNSNRTRTITIGVGKNKNIARYKGYPLDVSNKSIISHTGQNIKLSWSIHTSSNVKYKIWRSRKNKSGGPITEEFCATLIHSSTTWTDPLFKQTSSYTNYLLNYAIQTYYVPDDVDGNKYFDLAAFGNIDFWNMDSLNNENSNLMFEEPKNDVFIYPNPFNPSTTIEINLSKSGHVTADIYNMGGQRIKTLTNAILNKGKSSFFFDGANLASGVYLLRTWDLI